MAAGGCNARAGRLAAVERTEAGEVLGATRRTFRRACESSPTGTRIAHFRFAGLPVRVRVAGPELFDRLERCFAPLRADEVGEPVALTIDAWDREHTGVGCPGVAYSPDSTDAMGGGLFKQYLDGAVLHYERAGDLAAIDRPGGRIYFSVRSAGSMELHLQSKPFPYLLAAWYRDRGVQQLHAGLVSHDGRGALFVGRGGSGKSTCSLACALGGLDYLGDDYVGLQRVEEQYVGHTFYVSARVDDATVTRFPSLASHRIAPVGRWEEKAMVRISEVPRCRVVPSTRVRAIVLPRIGGSGPSRLSPAGSAEALRSLAPSSLMVPLGAGASGFAVLGDLVRRVPAFHLELGEDVRTVPREIVRLLEREER